MSRFDPRRIALTMLYGRWRRGCPFEDGYTILLPSPEDMPFLLQYALEGLRRIDTTNCRQILVVGDGWGTDGGEALRRVVGASDDPRVGMVRPNAFDRLVLRRLGSPGAAPTHWMAVVNGTTHARAAYAFLHDADAFFAEADGLERHYRACRDGGYSTLGVTARWDPFFEEVGYQIPGTWELMYSTRWARSRGPHALRPRVVGTPRGPYAFDSMLAPQYADYPTGRVGVLDPPPGVVHFNGTIYTYRAFRDRRGARVIDEEFRLLLLALLETLIPPAGGIRAVPTVDDLARGLEDPGAPVGYDSEIAVGQYPTFRRLLAGLCDAPIFLGERADRIAELIRPFDDHFRDLAPADGPPSRRIRFHGLGGAEF